MAKSRIQAEIDEDAIEDGEAVLEASARELNEVRASSLLIFMLADISPSPREKEQNAAMAEHNAVKEKHIATQTALATAEVHRTVLWWGWTWARSRTLAHCWPRRLRRNSRFA